MSKTIRTGERGVALLFTLLTILMLSAIVAALVTLTSTETTVNGNYRSEETAFFASRAGLNEVIDRMMQTNANSISGNIMSATGGAPFGAVIPSASNAGIFYLINQTSQTGTVAPWTASNKYADDELCHEGYTIAGMTSTSADIPCTTVPSGSAWRTSVNSNYPWSGTNAALPYVWVRVNWKLNGSSTYLTGTTSGGVTTLSNSAYYVNATQSATAPVCWNGASEIVLTSGSSCNTLASGGTADTPVFLITALAVTPTGARQMVQAEVAAPPPTVISTPGGFSDPDGFFAASTACSSSGGSSPFVLSGGASVDGYSSANGGTYSSTHSDSLGSIGSNGSIVISGSSTKVGGHVHVQHTVINGTCGPPATSDIFTSGGPTYGTATPIATYVPPVPTIPAPGAANETIHSNTTLPPGSYSNIKISSSTLTLTAPGVYNINCISMTGNSTLVISPPTAQVVVNVTGNSCTANAPIDLSGGAVSNTSGLAANLLFNYAGTQTVKLTGGSGAFMAVNAPNAAVALSGGSDFYGAIIASTVTDTGGVNLHFDNALTVSTSPATTTYTSVTSSYQTLAFRSLPY